MLIVFHVYIFVLYALYLATLQESAREMKVGNLLDTAHNILKTKLTVALKMRHLMHQNTSISIFSSKMTNKSCVGMIILSSVQACNQNLFFTL